MIQFVETVTSCLVQVVILLVHYVFVAVMFTNFHFFTILHVLLIQFSSAIWTTLWTGNKHLKSGLHC